MGKKTINKPQPHVIASTKYLNFLLKNTLDYNTIKEIKQ